MGSFGAAARRSPAGTSGARASSSRAPAAAIFENSRALSLRAMPLLLARFAAPRAATSGGPARVQSSLRRKRYNGSPSILRGDQRQLHHLLAGLGHVVEAAAEAGADRRAVGPGVDLVAQGDHAAARGVPEDHAVPLQRVPGADDLAVLAVGDQDAEGGRGLLRLPLEAEPLFRIEAEGRRAAGELILDVDLMIFQIEGRLRELLADLGVREGLERER